MNRKSRRSVRSSGGYTLLEIMVVLGIIAVLVGSAIHLLTGAINGAKMQRVDGDISTITSALRMYEINNETLPTTLQGLAALVTKPDTEPLPRRWTQLMSEVPQDPWQHPYVYVYPGKHNPSGFDIYSLGPQGIEGTDNIGNWK